MKQTSHCSDLLGGGNPPNSNLWEDLQALAALSRPETLPLMVDHRPAA